MISLQVCLSLIINYITRLNNKLALILQRKKCLNAFEHLKLFHSTVNLFWNLIEKYKYFIEFCLNGHVLLKKGKIRSRYHKLNQQKKLVHDNNDFNNILKNTKKRKNFKRINSRMMIRDLLFKKDIVRIKTTDCKVIPYEPKIGEFKKSSSFNKATLFLFVYRKSSNLNEKKKTILSKSGISEKHSNILVEKVEARLKANYFHAKLIEKNIKSVNLFIFGLNNLLTQTNDLKKLLLNIKKRYKDDDLRKQIFKNLNIIDNRILLNLPWIDLGGEGGNSKLKFYEISLRLNINARQNIECYYLKKKEDKVKMKKIENIKKELVNSHNTKIGGGNRSKIVEDTKSRRLAWWEKFYWFITSNRYLVIGGHNAQQNEKIVKKYLDPQRDIYIHAQIHGSTTIIKNPRGEQIPYQTLIEAGCFSACRSNSWKNKIAVGTFWVYGYQISKIPKSGEYLLNGSFLIRGRKNFIPPQPLIMGLGLLFVIDKESFELSHLKNNEDNYKQLKQFKKNLNDCKSKFSCYIKESNKRNSFELRTVRTLYNKNRFNYMPIFYKKHSRDKNVSQNLNVMKHIVSNLLNKDYRYLKLSKKDSKENKQRKNKYLKILVSWGERIEQLELSFIYFRSNKSRRPLENRNEIKINSSKQKIRDLDIHKKCKVKMKKKHLLVKQKKLVRKIRLAKNIENQLGLLTYWPLKQDKIFYSIPVCSPYICLKKYLFKVKVYPGTNNSISILKNILVKFQNKCKAQLPHLLQFVKAINVSDCEDNFLIDVKL